MAGAGTSNRLARRWFWALLLLAVVAMGALYTALGARPGPVAGAAVLLSSVVVLAAGAQAGRILMALERARPPEAPEGHGPGTAFGRRITAGERLFGARTTPAPEIHSRRS